MIQLYKTFQVPRPSGSETQAGAKTVSWLLLSLVGIALHPAAEKRSQAEAIGALLDPVVV